MFEVGVRERERERVIKEPVFIAVTEAVMRKSYTSNGPSQYHDGRKAITNGNRLTRFIITFPVLPFFVIYHESGKFLFFFYFFLTYNSIILIIQINLRGLGISVCIYLYK